MKYSDFSIMKYLYYDLGALFCMYIQLTKEANNII